MFPIFTPSLPPLIPELIQLTQPPEPPLTSRTPESKITLNLERGLVQMKKENSKDFVSFKEIIKENNEMIEKMNAERSKCKELVDNERESEDLRRISIRTFFSIIEAMCYRLKVSALSRAEIKGMRLKKQEIAIINEESFFLDEKGVPRIKKIYPKVTSNLRFAFKIFARVFVAEFKLDLGGDEWEEFQKAVDIRNRVTHPKNPSDMNVTKTDFKKVIRAFDWFVANIQKLFKAIKPEGRNGSH